MCGHTQAQTLHFWKEAREHNSLLFEERIEGEESLELFICTSVVSESCTSLPYAFLYFIKWVSSELTFSQSSQNRLYVLSTSYILLYICLYLESLERLYLFCPSLWVLAWVANERSLWCSEKSE